MLFFLIKTSFCHTIVLINIGEDNILINNSDLFGKGSAGLSLQQSDTIKLKCATQKIIISIGYGNSTQNNRFIILESNRTYLLSKRNGDIIVNGKDDKDYFSTQSAQLGNSFFKRFKSMQSDFEPLLSQSIKLTNRHKFLLGQYLERKTFLDSLSLAFQINEIIVENWQSLLYCNYIYNLYNYQTYKYFYKNNINQFYKDSSWIFLRQVSKYKFLENQISAIVYNKILNSIYNKNISDIRIRDFEPTSNLLFNDYCVSSILNSKLYANLIIDSNEIKQYLNICKNETYKYTITENIRLRGVQTISTNQKDNFLLINNERKIISIESIIKLSYNKIIYVDFWASWCMPCLREIKYSQRIIPELKKINCIYVYISTDDNITIYEKTSQQLGLSTYNYSFLAQNNNHDFLSNVLKLSTLPRYIIIRNGKIVNSMAPRPSGTNLLKTLKKY